jgi:molybdopterin-guanine dinucleotide biosynthesis protein A
MSTADKTRLVVGGRPLLDRVLASVTGAQSVVVVGEERATDQRVRWVQEQPPGGGPAAALAAGLEVVAAPIVVVLAGDLPFVTAEHVAALVDAITDDGAVFVDDTGREQWLCGAWRLEALRSLPLVEGASMRGSLAALRVACLRPRAHGPQVWFDCDSPEDIARAEEALS